MKVLASDLDRTLLPNGEWPLEQNSIEEFNKLVKKNQVVLIYVTGRSLALAQQGIQEHNFIEPEIFITDVGAKIWKKQQNKWTEDKDWQEHIKKEHPCWNIEKIKEKIKQVPGVIRQEEKNNSLFKQSYYAQNKEQVEQVKELLKGEFDEHIIDSFDPTIQQELIDIMPKRLSKLSAIQFTQKKLRITNKDIIYCGDSGNDIEALKYYQGVLVRNADNQLLQAIKDNPNIFFAQENEQGNGYYVNGVIQGAYHFRIFL